MQLSCWTVISGLYFRRIQKLHFSSSLVRQIRYPLLRFAVSTTLRTWGPPPHFKTMPRVHTPVEGCKGLTPSSLRRFVFIGLFHQKESPTHKSVPYSELGYFPYPSRYVPPRYSCWLISGASVQSDLMLPMLIWVAALGRCKVHLAQEPAFHGSHKLIPWEK